MYPANSLNALRETQARNKHKNTKKQLRLQHKSNKLLEQHHTKDVMITATCLGI